MSELVWYKSLYWRIAFGFVATLAVLKIVLGWPLQLAALASMVWLLSRNRTPVAPDAAPA